jgi:hypothetical protein
MIKTNSPPQLNLLFKDIVEFDDEQFGKLIGMVVGKFNERKDNFYYCVSVRYDDSDEDEESEKRSYKLDKEKSGKTYIFHVYPKNITRMVKKHKSNIDKIEKEKEK